MNWGGKCLLDRKGSEVFTKQKFAWDCLELWDQADAQKIFSLFHCIFLLIFCLHVYLNSMSVRESCPRLVCEFPDIILALQKQLENQQRRNPLLPRNGSRCKSSKECFIKTVIKFTQWITRICSLPVLQSIVATVTEKRNSSFVLMKSSRCHTAQRANIPSKQQEKRSRTFCNVRSSGAGRPLGILSTFSLKVVSICKFKLTAVWAEAVQYDWKMRAVICLNVDLDVSLYSWAHFDILTAFPDRFVFFTWSC